MPKKAQTFSPLPEAALEIQDIADEEETVQEIDNEVEKLSASAGLGFAAAIKRVVEDGARITRIAWSSPQDFVYMGAFLMIHRTDNTIHQWIVSKEDVEATDWVSV